MLLEINIPKEPFYMFPVMFATGDQRVRKEMTLMKHSFTRNLQLCHHTCHIQLDMVLGVELTLI